MRTAKPYWVEKLQAYAVSGAALAVVYLLVGPALKPADPLGSYTLAGSWGIGQFVAFSAVLLVVSAAAGAATISARPAAAMLAVFAGAAGLSLRSQSIRPAFWSHPDQLSSLYGGFALELLALAVVVFACAVVIGMVRRRLGSARPAWRWQDLRANLTADERAKLGDAAGVISDWLSYEPLMLLPAGRSGGDKAFGKALGGILARSMACFGGGAFAAIVLLLILMRSGERGQVLFAIFFSFMLSVLVVHKMLPTPWMLIAWAMPILVGLMFCVLASASMMDSDSLAWLSVPLYARALPIDWVSAGGAGAMVGFWTSTRVHELRILAAEEKKAQ